MAPDPDPDPGPRSSGLRIADAPADPFELLARWLEEAERCELPQPVAMALATSLDDQPTVRIVLLRGLDAHGLVFYTNYTSRKARELETNPRAAAAFYWAQLYRQVRVEGRVERVSKEESDAYFRTRPRGARIGAWASPQSQVLESRRELEEAVAACEQRFVGDEDPPRPPFWGGYRILPERFEFWAGRENRLHDRILYLPDGEGGWNRSRLAP